METYKNDYKKDEDYCLWELHEIRHEIREEYKNKDIDEINKIGRKLYDELMKNRNKHFVSKVS